MEYREADTRQVSGGRASGDDTTARFLQELRELRHGAGLGHAELAARAHFPYDSIRAAELGPALPDLPVLSAFVRGCGGTTEEWEERWRSLTSSPSLPVSASRNAGRSDAATAGARIGSASQVGDSPDPSIIIAALSRVAEEMASPNTDGADTDGTRADALPASSGVLPSDDILSTDTSLPSAPRAVDPVSDSLGSASGAFRPASEAVTGNKPAGWDPIRVSTAWPAIRDMPTEAPAGSIGFSGKTGAGAPWGTAPRGEGSLDAASPATGAGGPTTAGTPSRPARVPAAASRPGPAVSRDGGSIRPASWTRIVVVAAVLLCVLAVLLAVFA